MILQNRLYVFSLVIMFSSALTTAEVAHAQHSLQLDDGLTHFSTIIAPNPGGQYLLPPNGGTLLTSGNLGSFAWILGGNNAPVPNIFGTTTATDVDMRASNT